MSFTVSLAQVEEALERAVRDEEEAARRVLAIRKIVEGLRDLNGHASDVFGEPQQLAVLLPVEKVSRPRGREAVRRVVSDRPGLWSLHELREAMKEHGWFTSAKAVEVAVTRLCESGDAARIAKGVYKFPADYREEVTIESEASVAAVIAS